MASDMSFSGFSGIDTAGMVEALMAIESKRLSRVQAQRTTLVSQQTAWNTVSSSLSTLSTAAAGVSSSRLMSTTVTSSSPSVLAKGSAPVGSVSFAVDRLATSSLHAVSGLAAPTAGVGAGTLTLAQGLTKIGIARVDASAAGSYDIAVVDAGRSPALSASFSGTLTVAADTELTLTARSGSTTETKTVTLAAGNYSHASLAGALDAQLAGSPFAVSESGGFATFSVTTARGSAHSLEVSGPAAALLGLPASASGRDVVVDVGATRTTLSSAVLGGSVQVSDGSSLLTLHLAADGLAVGNGTARSFSFSADSTVSDVASAVNGADGSPAVAGILGGTGTTQILFTSKNSGVDYDLGVSWSGFSAGSAAILRSGSDAQLSMGSQVVSRSSNVITDLVPGATLTLVAPTSDSEVTITGAVDTSGIASKITSFVNAVNDTLSTLDTLMRTTPGNPGANGALSGDSSARALRRSIVSTMSQSIGSGDYSSLPAVGITMGRDGKFVVNQSDLAAAISADPEGVTRLFSQATASTQEGVSFLAAPASVSPGDYAVTVTRAAERASVSSSIFAEVLSPEVLTLTVGGSSVGVTLEAGLTPSQVAARANEKLASAKIAAFAEVTSDSRVRFVTEAFGSSASLSVASTGADLGLSSASAEGVNVAGTIDGLAAAGVGQTLTGASASTTGLSLQVRTHPALVAAAGGSLAFNVSYTSGVAGLVRTALEAARSAGGAVDTAQTSTASGLQRTDAELERVRRMLEMTESRLRKQFSALEAALARIKSSVPNFAALPTWNNE